MLQIEQDEMKLERQLENLKYQSGVPHYTNLASETPGSPSLGGFNSSVPRNNSKTFKMNGKFYQIGNDELKSILENFQSMKTLQ